ncbi:MAG: hypothetical protein ACRENH_12705 [Gemmatimonadaceae bacterium]
MTARLLAVIAVSIASAACQAPTQRFTVRDVAALQALLDVVAADIRAKKWESVGDHFSDDASFVAVGAVIGGSTAIANWSKSLPPLETFSFGPAEVHGDAGLAYALSAVYVKFRDLPADTGKQLVVFRRGSDRRWVVQAVSVSIDLPPFPPAHTTRPTAR